MENTAEEKTAEENTVKENPAWYGRVVDVFRSLNRDKEDKEEWETFLAEVGFNLKAPAENALQPLSAKALVHPAFSDMPADAQWIAPGQPARSALYHLLASADAAPGLPPPTQQQIETVENAVYAARNFDGQKLRAYVAENLPSCERDSDGNIILIAVVFACEYRASGETPHGHYADMCYARTGVARVGTVDLPYEAGLRSYPFIDSGDPSQIPILPARYAVYLAASCPGTPDLLGYYQQPGDEKRKFWVPVHKLFPGADCLTGLRIEVGFDARHVNEKLRRFHHYMHSQNISVKVNAPDTDTDPFTFTQGIANVSESGLGSCEVRPIARLALTEAANHQNAPLTYRVPPFPNGVTGMSSSSLFLKPADVPAGEKQAHPAPELLSARHRVEENGHITNMNTLSQVEIRVMQGGYEALHFKDFTGDGWVEARVGFSSLNGDLHTPLECLAAYSLVSPPDFLPRAGQRAVKTLFEAQVPSRLQTNFWNTPPDSLADQRDAPNLTLNRPQTTGSRRGAGFKPDDDTVTAIVTAPYLPAPNRAQNSAGSDRRSCLPDNAAGVFAPGWDVGLDINEDKVYHLAMYSLGSPFLTDSKICCALSAFWPAAAPDTTRNYEPTSQPDRRRYSVVPLTDGETGLMDSPAWDGIPGPRLVPAQPGEFSPSGVEYQMSAYADYTELFLEPLQGRPLRSPFYLWKLAEITTEEYVRRLIAMFRAYKALGVPVDLPMTDDALAAKKAEWAVLSFRPADTGDPKFQQAQQSQCGGSEAPFFKEARTTYFFDMYQWDQKKPFQPVAGNMRRVIVFMKMDDDSKPIQQQETIRRQLFAGDEGVLLYDATAGKWQEAPRVIGLQPCAKPTR